MPALSTAELVDFLDAGGDLHQPDDELWPSYDPDGDQDLYQVDWRTLFTEDAQDIFIAEEYLDADWVDEVGDAMGTGAPGPQVEGGQPDVCAWYHPIHFHGMGWGIFILDDCLRDIALAMASFVDSALKPLKWTIAPALIRMSFASLFLHEAFHHKTESLAIRLAVTERAGRFQDYWSKVYSPATRGGGPLEEALANADSFKRLSETAYRMFVPDPVYEAARQYLRWRFPLDPPGYCDAVKYLSERERDTGVNRLKSQVQEARENPFRTVAQWRMAPNMNESLFGLRSDIWEVVDRGRRPSVPTFPLYRPVSTRDLLAQLKSVFGYEPAKGRGKGSHVRLEADGYPPLTVPGGRKDLSPPVLKSVAAALGFRDIGDLLAALRL